MSRSLPSPPQTVGPFFHDCLMRSHVLPSPSSVVSSEMEKIRVQGRITDGVGEPVDDALLEVWHVELSSEEDAASTLKAGYFYRIATQEDGYYSFETVRPASRSRSEDAALTHLNMHLFARGLLDRLATRAYLENDVKISTDRYLASLPVGQARTLIATRVPDQERTYRFDIRLQGDEETAFFDV